MLKSTLKSYAPASADAVQQKSSLLLAPTRLHLLLVFIFSSFTALSSLFFLAWHAHHPVPFGILFFVLLLASGLLLLYVPLPIRQFLSSPYFAVFCIVFVGIFGEAHYRRNIEPRPEFTAAPALVQPAQRILHGQDPYSLRLAQGAEISPGPGWIMLLAPLTLLHGAGLINALGLTVVVLLLNQRGPLSRGIFLLLMMVQPLFVNESQWGTDLFAIFLVFGALCLLAEKWVGNPGLMLTLGLLTGFFIQSRVPMVLFFLILVLGIWRKDRTSAVWFSLPAVVVASCFYALFYLWAVHDKVFFQPFHLAGRARASGSSAGIITRVATAIALLWIGWKLDERVKSWILAGGFLALALFAPTGLGELANDAPSLRGWEGANYVSLGLSLFAIYLALEVARPQTGEAVMSSAA